MLHEAKEIHGQSANLILVNGTAARVRVRTTQNVRRVIEKSVHGSISTVGSILFPISIWQSQRVLLILNVYRFVQK